MKKTSYIVLTLLIFTLIFCVFSGKAFADSSTKSEITVKHALGTTVIPQKPERVATIAWCNQDVALALGVAPVGMSRMNFAVDETGVFPWTWEKLKQLGVDNPVVFEDIDGLDYEAIADTHPDVILAGYSGITQEEYDRLSEIAPVVAYAKGPWISTWREQTIINGEGLGLKDEAEKLILETEALIAEKVANYPAIKDKSIAFCWFSPDDLGNFYIYTNNDPRAIYLNDLGFVVPNSVAEEAAKAPEAFAVTVSAENADKFKDIDVIITYGDKALLEAMQGDARLSTIPAIANGAVALLDSNNVIAASSTPSILSIPYMIDDYLDLLNGAAEKVK
ncbi:MAG: ABC transporter substrate-binding protein [Christensenellaceae bacterium]|nr:ABC transporter substrate-binding protein [Christensenellaceae bacterium]